MVRQQSQAVLGRIQRHRLPSPKVEIWAQIELHSAPDGGFGEQQNFIFVNVFSAQQSVAVLSLA